MRLPFRYVLLAVTVCVLNASLALGASVTVTSSGGGVFSVQGDNMKGMSGIELTIGYDTSVLSSPTVRWGALVFDADMHIANTTVPGSIRVAIIKTGPFSENSGPIAAISFATQNSSCGITSVSAKIVDSSSVHVPVQASVAPGASCAAADTGLISTPGVPFSQPPAPGAQPSAAPAAPATVSGAAAPSPSAQLPAGLGTISMPGDAQPRKEEKPAESKPVSPPEPAETAETAPLQSKQVVPEKTAEEVESNSTSRMAYGSVLNRFRTHTGEKTPAALIALFSEQVSPSIHQIPPVAISDGTATIRVSVDQSAIKGTSTNFALNGAKLVSLKKEDGSGRWLLEIMPHPNSLTASVTILNSSSIIEFPLTVVPPAAAVTGKKADFDAFLTDSGAQVPKYDLNGDGRHDYMDDYIYTGHYVMRSGAAAR